MSEPVFAQVIETPRMWLRCPLPGDGDALYQCVQQTLAQLQTWPDSLPWAQQPQSPDISEDYCQTCYAAWVMGLRWPLLMWDKHTAQLAGSVGFHHINHDTHMGVGLLVQPGFSRPSSHDRSRGCVDRVSA